MEMKLSEIEAKSETEREREREQHQLETKRRKKPHGQSNAKPPQREVPCKHMLQLNHH